MSKTPCYRIKQFFQQIGLALSRILRLRPSSAPQGKFAQSSSGQTTSGQTTSGRRRSARHQPLRISWVIPGKLAVGGSPLEGDSALLQSSNIKVVLSLCANSEKPLPTEVSEQFRCLRLVLPDSHYNSSIKPSQLAAAIDVIHHSVENRLPIYVHCLAGIERSPTVCIAYLCCYHKLELWEAINWLKQVHPLSMPTEAQLRAVRLLMQQHPKRQPGQTIPTQ